VIPCGNRGATIFSHGFTNGCVRRGGGGFFILGWVSFCFWLSKVVGVEGAVRTHVGESCITDPLEWEGGWIRMLARRVACIR